MRIHHIHPKFMGDEVLMEEHHFLHGLFNALSGEGGAAMDNPDFFRFRGKRGQLYLRHRKLAEEMATRAISHVTVLDRRDLMQDEWGDPALLPEEVLSDVLEIREGSHGRVPLPESGDPQDFVAAEDLCSAVPGPVDLGILRGLWRVYRFVVMERSYSRYRSLIDPVQGRGSGSVWMLFDLMMEEAFALEPEENGPRIAYETIWEFLVDGASEPEKEEFQRLFGALEPGKVSLPMRRFLAAAANRQGNEDLTASALLNPHIGERDAIGNRE